MTEMQKIASDATEQLERRSRYSIQVRIGIAWYTFTLRRIGSYGYTLKRNEDIITEHDRASRVITALCEEIQAYV